MQPFSVSPSDPDAHRARGSLQLSTTTSRSRELARTAVALRYRDDYLWIELGNTEKI